MYNDNWDRVGRCLGSMSSSKVDSSASLDAYVREWAITTK
jgi:hypothetical protein